MRNLFFLSKSIVLEQRTYYILLITLTPLHKIYDMKRIKKYKIKHADIAKWFNYSSEYSFNSSKAKDDMLSGIEKVILYVEQQLITGLRK